MLRTKVWNDSVSRVVLDHRSREAHLRLERIEGLKPPVSRAGAGSQESTSRNASPTPRGAAKGREIAMAEYLLIESRDPFESNDVGYYYDLARGLVDAGEKVTLFLVQNGVFATRPSAKAPQLRVLVGSGVKILAHDFALKERGITKLLDGVQIAPIEIVVDHLEAGHQTLWH